MTTATGQGYGLGVRRAIVWETDDTGFPDVSGTALDYGTDVGGGRNFDINIPSRDVIHHMDNDIVQASDSLPPKEGVTGSLVVGNQNLAVFSMLTGVEERTVGEGKWMQWYTDKQGDEPKVALFLAQQFTAKSTGARNWNQYIIPSCTAIPSPSSFNDTGSETTFDIVMSPVTKSVWGELLTLTDDGATKSSFAQNQSVGKTQLCFAKGDGSVVEFLFDTDLPATAVGKISVFVDGTEVTTGTTETVTGVTWASAPADGAKIAIIYES